MRAGWHIVWPALLFAVSAGGLRQPDRRERQGRQRQRYRVAGRRSVLKPLPLPPFRSLRAACRIALWRRDDIRPAPTGARQPLAVRRACHDRDTRWRIDLRLRLRLRRERTGNVAARTGRPDADTRRVPLGAPEHLGLADAELDRRTGRSCLKSSARSWFRLTTSGRASSGAATGWWARSAMSSMIFPANPAISAPCMSGSPGTC